MNLDIDHISQVIYEDINLSACDCVHRQKIIDPFGTGDSWYAENECLGSYDVCPIVRHKLTTLKNDIEGIYGK